MTVITWLNDIQNQKNDVNHIPDAKAAQSNELSYSDASVSDTAAVDSEYAQKYRVEQRRNKVLVGVSEKFIHIFNHPFLQTGFISVNHYFIQGASLMYSRGPRHSIFSNTRHVTFMICISPCFVIPHFKLNHIKIFI